MASFAITLYGQFCRLHLTGQQVVSDIRVILSCWSICSLRFEINDRLLICYYTPAHWCTWNVYFASNTKHSLPYNMAACTRWPWIQNLVTSLHLIYTDAGLLRLNSLHKNVAQRTPSLLLLNAVYTASHVSFFFLSSPDIKRLDSRHLRLRCS